jgi:hypothetical protein
VNINKTVNTDNLDIPTPTPPHIISTAQRPRPRMDWPAIVATGAIGLVFLAFVYFVLPAWVFMLCVSLLALWFAKSYILTDTVAGIPIRTYRNDVRGSQVVNYIGTAAIEDARRELPNSISSYNPSAPAAPKALVGPVVETESVTVLPNIGPLAVVDWLARLNEQPHAIFAAKTKGGKSTMAKFGMQPRIAAGESFFVIDPHANGWLDLPSVGGGLRWNEVRDGILAITDLYRDRHAERRRYIDETGDELDHDFFPRLNVILDEANEMRLELNKIDKRVWEPFMQVMGSGARKVGLSLWLICQSALIKNLGGSETMRRNYTVFALDHMTIAELVEDEEKSKARREMVIQGIAGQTFPAATVLNGQAFLLDRAGIDRAPIASARSLAWQGWQPRQIARSVVAAKEQTSTVVRASVVVPDAGAIVYPPAVKSTNGKIAWLLNNGYSYRQIERELNVSHATISQVNKAIKRSQTT